MITNLVGWVVFGLLVGALARVLYPGNQGLGLARTMFLGIAGSLVGGGMAYLLRLGQAPYTASGWILSIVGAILLLSLGFFAKRTTTVSRF
jgi:uncharacterized membrane protein YeaQ/YmgE (transglycosylase-associated protein family)